MAHAPSRSGPSGASTPLVALALACTASLAAQGYQPRFGSGPWIFLQRGVVVSPPVAIRYDGKLSSPAQLELDNGTTATLSVRPAPCDTSETCAPADCGCHGVDRFALTIEDSDGVPLFADS